MTKHTPEPLRVGLIGCGDIARKAYLPFAATCEDFRIVACADLRADMAQALAADFEIPRVLSVDALLADPQIDMVLNLTHPAAHAEINLQALENGKHVYCEKPFALNLDDGKRVLQVAEEKGLRVGCAPDTVLGPGTQTARQAIADGLIGEPVAARLMWGGGGHESWHPNPAFYYQVGGGPMLDMGPYYLTALVELLGPLRSVTGRSRQALSERLITSEPLNGTRVPVEVPTHYSGVVETRSGAHALTLMSFDMPGRGEFDKMPEIIGTLGTLKSSDPNRFDGTVYLRRAGEENYTELPATHAYPAGRGLGLADMALAIREGRPHRASGEKACHILEAMLAFDEAERTGRRVDLSTPCVQSEAMPSGGLSTGA
ncbi:Gfo/Idh/MocA family oxidoreductase [Ruficoccus sp. ZRK36]|uniref:Gfo/Idh/MocA family protein n=1 Tax=Ruficoccus sp. ZRK36 TaxID=2866311 RepID=UPI001C736A86|nr:Gfo/Idh/MocA family oxidoreductase [Ruficoccus sp. ZRK36]QYY36236.1 Gfo/Idh/MocA family oxidoreductase [Ruficoccus sp. ZRK36]